MSLVLVTSSGSGSRLMHELARYLLLMQLVLQLGQHDSQEVSVLVVSLEAVGTIFHILDHEELDSFLLFSTILDHVSG